MSSGSARPFVSVKFAPAGRTYSFLLPEFALDAPLNEDDTGPPVHGDQVIVNTPEGTALGTVTRVVPGLVERRTPAAESPARFVRRATRAASSPATLIT